MGLKLNNITTVTVATAGTRAQAQAASQYCISVYVEALKTNTGVIYGGDISVSATQYTAALTAGSGFVISTDAQGKASGAYGGEFQLNSLYFDTSVSGSGVQVSYLTRVGPA